MKAQQMREMALEASRKQFKEVIDIVKSDAQKGDYCSIVPDLRDGIIDLLTQEGYQVTKRQSPINSYKISYGKLL